MKNHSEMFLICDVAYKSPYCKKSLSIIIKVGRSKYIALSHSNDKYERIFDISKYLIMLKAIFQTFILRNIQKLKLIWMMIYL